MSVSVRWDQRSEAVSALRQGSTPHLCAYCSENFRIISRLFVSFLSAPAMANARDGWFQHSLAGCGGKGARARLGTAMAAGVKPHHPRTIPERPTRIASLVRDIARLRWLLGPSRLVKQQGTHGRMPSSPSARTDTQRRARRHRLIPADCNGNAAPRKLAVACMAADRQDVRATRLRHGIDGL